MKRALRALLDDRELWSSTVETGLRTIKERHTCRHRAEQLVGIVQDLRATGHSKKPLRYIGASA